MNTSKWTWYCVLCTCLTVPSLLFAASAGKRSPCDENPICIEVSDDDAGAETSSGEIRPAEHQVSPTAAVDTMGGYFRCGGLLRMTFGLYKRYSLGFRVGLLTSSPDLELPIDIVNAWDFPVGKSRVDIVFNLVTGISIWWDDHINERLPILNLQVETGVKVRITKIVGIAALFHLGAALPDFRAPKIVVGGQLGPVFYF